MLTNSRDIGGKAGPANGPAASPVSQPKDQGGTGAPDRALDLKATGFFRDFMTGLTEPAMIPAFLAGGLTYRAIRSGVAGSWVASPAVKSLSGLFGRQLGASTLALGGETVVFTGAHRSASALTQDWRGATPVVPSLGSDMAGTGIMLASLRSFGFGFGMLGATLQRSGVAGAGTQFLLSQAGSYTGLLAAQQLEHRLLHPEIPEMGNPYLNAAVSLIHFTGFGMMARNITPRSWQVLERGLEQKTHRLLNEKAERIRNGLTPQRGGPGLAWQTAGLADASKISSLRDPKTEGLQFMLGRRPPGPKEAPVDPLEFRDRFAPKFQEAVAQIDKILDANQSPFLHTFAQTKIADRDTLILGIVRIQSALEFSQVESGKSSYLHWIINLGLRRIVEKRDGEALDKLMTMISQATPMRDIETFVAQQMPATRLPEPWMGISKRFKRKSDYYETIEKMPISEEAKKTLWLLLLAQKKGPDEAPYYINPHDFFHRLGEVRFQHDSKWGLVETILEKASSSPLGILRLRRLHLVLRSELEMASPLHISKPQGMLGSKLRELAHDQYQTNGYYPNPLPKNDAEIFNGPQGGFFGEHGPWRLLKDMLPQIPDLIDPVQADARATLRRSVLKAFIASHPGEAPFKPENVAMAYRMLATAFKGKNYESTQGAERGDFSLHTAMAIQQGEFTLEVLDKKNYDRRFHEINEKLAQMEGKGYVAEPVLGEGYLFHHGSLKATPQGKPLILIARPEFTGSSPEKFLDDYFQMLSAVTHEVGHLFEQKKFPKSKHKEHARMKEELNAETRNIWWLAQHGDIQRLRNFSWDSPTGFATRLGDWWEHNYRQAPPPPEPIEE